MRKILYSPGYGAGWTTWESNPEIKKFMLTYKPIVDFLEAGGSFSHEETHVEFKDGPKGKRTEPDFSKLHPILQQFVKECMEKFGNYPYLGGARDLRVAEVSDGPVKIEEYDGNESFHGLGYDSDEWL